MAPVDIVVVPHHGSRTSSTPDFVAATRPRWVIYAVGYRNRWGFPVRRVVERWQQAGARGLRTSTGGAITFDLAPGRALAPPAEWRRERRGRGGILEPCPSPRRGVCSMIRGHFCTGTGTRARLMFEIVKAGGIVMVPLILCSILAAAITLERLWTLRGQRVVPEELTDKVWRWVENRTLSDKQIMALQQHSPLGRVLAAGLANRHRDRSLMIEAHRGRRPPRRARTRALPERASHDRGHLAAARPARHRHRHDPHLQGHHRRRRG